MNYIDICTCGFTSCSHGYTRCDKAADLFVFFIGSPEDKYFICSGCLPAAIKENMAAIGTSSMDNTL